MAKKGSKVHSDKPESPEAHHETGNGGVLDEFIPCTAMSLPEHLALEAAQTAILQSPSNAPNTGLFATSGEELSVQHLALLTGKYWGTDGVRLSVQFLDIRDTTLQQRILSHMNAWGERANVSFAQTNQSGEVRIATTPRQGYWSYLGTDIRHIPMNQPTMNLDSFSMNTPEAEYHRVVRHETGHTLGFPHEHMRPEMVSRLDPAKTIAYFQRTQGWNAQMTQQQVLTPLNNALLTFLQGPDDNSIMCYSLPGSITKDGLPIVGGLDINEIDWQLAMRVYPKSVTPTPTPTPPPPTPVPTPTPTVPGAKFMVLLDANGQQIVRYSLTPTF